MILRCRAGPVPEEPPGRDAPTDALPTRTPPAIPDGVTGRPS